MPEKVCPSTDMTPIGTTMVHMYQRELKRVSNGHYKKSKSEELWAFFLVLTFSALAGTIIFQTKNDFLQGSISKLWKEITVFTFAVPLFIYAMLKISLVIRWCLYWIVVATGLLFILDLFEKQPGSNNGIGFWVFVGFVIVEVLTIFVHVAQSFLIPKIALRASKYDPTRFWDIKPIPNRKGWYTRRRFLGFGKRKTFSYIGQLNDAGLPHGYGKWTSEWEEGEVLSGYWENGIPVGPFKSREYSTGYSFGNLRIGFISTVNAGFTAESFAWTSQKKYGVASIECSSSGRFFSDLPHLDLIYDPFNGNQSNLQECLQKIVHISDFPEARDPTVQERIIINYSPTKGFSVDGYAPLSRRSRLDINLTCTTENGDALSDILSDAGSSTQAKLHISGWEKCSTETEVLLYIPGFNCSVHDAIEALGQMLTLCQMPSRIKPIVLGWPGGSLFKYAEAKKVAKSDRTREDIIEIIRELIEQGITKIHILCHSMGARLVANASQDFHKVFHNDKRMSDFCTLNSDSSMNEKAELASVTFLNPEHPLDDFVDFTFGNIRAFCPLITIYGSDNDLALNSAQYIFSWKRILGCNVQRLMKNGAPLDLDVIDTTELDMNIHAARHSYFNLNKYVIDDVAAIITSCKRASHREKNLLLIHDNVYGFLTAPSYIVN